MSISIFISSRGFSQHHFVPCNAKCNALTQRVIRFVLDTMCCNIAHSRLPDKYWKHALSNTIFKYSPIWHKPNIVRPFSQWPSDLHIPDWLPLSLNDMPKSEKHPRKLEVRGVPCTLLNILVQNTFLFLTTLPKYIKYKTKILKYTIQILNHPEHMASPHAHHSQFTMRSQAV